MFSDVNNYAIFFIIILILIAVYYIYVTKIKINLNGEWEIHLRNGKPVISIQHNIWDDSWKASKGRENITGKIIGNSIHMVSGNDGQTSIGEYKDDRIIWRSTDVSWTRKLS